jgi:hypothetical protein
MKCHHFLVYFSPNQCTSKRSVAFQSSVLLLLICEVYFSPQHEKGHSGIPHIYRNKNSWYNYKSYLPVLLGQSLANNSKRMSRSTLMERAWILKMCVRPSRSGSPNSTFLSSRPGLMRAGSSVSGRFVAMSTCNMQHAIRRFTQLWIVLTLAITAC